MHDVCRNFINICNCYGKKKNILENNIKQLIENNNK